LQHLLSQSPKIVSHPIVSLATFSPTFQPCAWLFPLLPWLQSPLLIGWMNQEFALHLTKAPEWAHLSQVCPGTSSVEWVMALQWP
jgi:hypothetical protein